MAEWTASFVYLSGCLFLLHQDIYACLDIRARTKDRLEMAFVTDLYSFFLARVGGSSVLPQGNRKAFRLD